MFIEELLISYYIYIKLVFHGSEMELIEEAIVSCLWVLELLTPNDCEIVLSGCHRGFRKPGNNCNNGTKPKNHRNCTLII